MKKILAALVLLHALFASPDALALDSRFMMIVATGSLHSCSLNDLGAVVCWGNNSSGAVGDGTVSIRATPVEVTGLSSGVAAIAAGGDTTCALTTTGGVKCWGSNLHGQVGDGSTTDRLVPTDVTGLGTGVIGISVGLAHACAVTNTGVVKCWGGNDHGQLGDGTTNDSTVPVDVSGLPPGMLAVSAGHAHTCALTNAGAVKCWGDNSSGQLGNGTVGTTASSLLPVDSGIASGAAAVNSGAIATAVIMSNGGVKYWGSLDGVATTPTDVPALTSGVTSLSLGQFMRCVVAAGAAKCWGSNPLGSVIGDAVAVTQSPQPIAAPTDVATLSSGAAAISVGSAHACAVTTAGAVKCWGGTSAALGASPAVRGEIVTVNFPGVVQTVNLGTIASSRDAHDVPFAVSATATSGLSVTLSTTTPSVCTFGGSTLTLTGALGICTLTASQAGDAVYEPASVTRSFLVEDLTQTLAPRLRNISTRMQVLTGNDQAIAGFAVRGPAAKTVVIRARGPSLTALGVPGALQDPVLVLRANSGGLAQFNDNWETPSNASVLRDIGFAPTDSRESALLVTLQPGLYSAVMSGAAGSTGAGLIEVFELDAPDSPLINIATRGKVLTGDDVMIAGFIINGNAPQTVVVRARGPSLPGLAAGSLLANPLLQLVRSSDQAVIATNDNWQDASNAADLAASGYQPLDPNEAGILITLQPGAYSAIVTGVGGTTGIGLVEVFAQ